MGFLKFLKREKKKEDFNELDLPPAPPSFDLLDEGHDLMPGTEDTKMKVDEKQKFDLPAEQDFDFSEDMNFDLGDEGAGKEEKMPEFPKMPDFEEDSASRVPSLPPAVPSTFQRRIMPAPTMDVEEHEEKDEQLKEPAIQAPDFQKAAKKYLFPEESPTARHHTFVKVEKFKPVLDSISIIRGNLRKSEEALLKLEQMKAGKDRSYDKFKASLDDLQKKLIFIDKTLFKGE